MKKIRTQNLNFGSNLDPLFSGGDNRNQKMLEVVHNISAIRLSKYVQIKALSSLFFPGKTRLLFYTILGYFW